MAFHFVFPRLPISKHVQIIVNWNEQIFWTVLIWIMNEKLTQRFAVQKLGPVIFEAQRTSPLTQTLHWNFRSPVIFCCFLWNWWISGLSAFFSKTAQIFIRNIPSDLIGFLLSNQSCSHIPGGVTSNVAKGAFCYLYKLVLMQVFCELFYHLQWFIVAPSIATMMEKR